MTTPREDTQSAPLLILPRNEDQDQDQEEEEERGREREEKKEPISFIGRLSGLLPSSNRGIVGEIDSLDKQKSVQSVKVKWPSRGNRYLHQVQYNEPKDQVFAGWNVPTTTNKWFEDDEEFFKFYTNKKTYEERLPQVTQKHRRIVFVDSKIKRITNINTSKQSFRTTFHYYLTWLATYDEWKSQSEWEAENKNKQRKGANSKKEDGDDANKWAPDWIPDIEFSNAIDVKQQSQKGEFKIKRGTEYKNRRTEIGSQSRISQNGISFSNQSIIEESAWEIPNDYLGFDPNLGYWIRVQYDADVIFAEQLELDSFPFDCQDFTLLFKLSEKGFNEADLLPFPRNGDFLTLDRQFSVISEWKMENMIAEFYYTDPRGSRSFQSHAVMAVRIKASRVWGSYSTEMLITLGMYILGLGTFALGVEESDLGSRLSYCVVFLLADVTTLQMLSQKLPEIQYFTILDYYALICFGFLFAVTIWSCFAGAFLNQSHDSGAFIFFFIVFLLIQIIFLSISVSRRRWERQKLYKTHKEVQEQIKQSIFCRSFYNGHITSISLEWNQETYLGNFDDYSKQRNAFAPNTSELIAFGSATDKLKVG